MQSKRNKRFGLVVGLRASSPLSRYNVLNDEICAQRRWCLRHFGQQSASSPNGSMENMVAGQSTTHELYSRLRSQRSHLNLTFCARRRLPADSHSLSSTHRPLQRDKLLRTRTKFPQPRHRGEIPSSLVFDLRGDYGHCVPAQNVSSTAALDTANTSAPAHAQAGRHSARRRRSVPALYTVPSRTLRTPTLHQHGSVQPDVAVRHAHRAAHVGDDLAHLS